MKKHIISLFILFGPVFTKLNPDILIFSRVIVLYSQFEESWFILRTLEFRKRKWFVSSDHIMMTEIIFPFLLGDQKLRIKFNIQIECTLNPRVLVYLLYLSYLGIYFLFRFWHIYLTYMWKYQTFCSYFKWNIK